MSDHLERLEAHLERESVPLHLAADLRDAVAELKQLRADIEEVAGDRNGHRDRQIWAERVLAVLLAREGGATELTPAELTRANLDGSFVSSRDVATGNERIEFRASRRRRAAPQQPTPDGEA